MDALDGYQSKVTALVTPKAQLPRAVTTETKVFWSGTHSPGTQDGTRGKPCFAGAENLSKPDIQNLKKPETQDAAKPNKTLHTLLAQGFVPEFLESIRARERCAAAGTRTDTASKPVSAAG